LEDSLRIYIKFLDEEDEGKEMNQKKIIFPKFSPTDKQNAALAPKEKMNPEYDGVYFATKPAWWSWQFW